MSNSLKVIRNTLVAVCFEERYFVILYTCAHSLVPRPNSMIVGLQMRLVHKQNHKLADMFSSRSKVYEHHLAKALHSAANIQIKRILRYSFSKL